MKITVKSPRTSTFVTFGTVALATFALTACGSDKSDPSKDVSHTAAPAATSAPAAMTNAPAGTNAPAALNGPGATTAPAATVGPNGRSAVPTLDEWTAAKEVGVKGSTKLNCETKMVREWLRVSCRGKNETGGEAKSVTIKKGGGHGDTFTASGASFASLVLPFVDGTDFVAVFEWSDMKKELVVSWPHGAPMPPLKGEFR